MSRMPNKPDNWRFDAVEVRHDRDGKPVSRKAFSERGLNRARRISSTDFRPAEKA